MSISNRLETFLKSSGIHYKTYRHPEAFTASETAEAGHFPGKKFIKAVMLKVEGRHVMVVVPSNRTVDLLKVSSLLAANDVRVIEEGEFRDLFPDSEPGAMPPFGVLYGVPCYVDVSLWDEKEVYFNAGTHREAVSVAGSDYFRAARALSGDFSVTGKKVGV